MMWCKLVRGIEAKRHKINRPKTRCWCLFLCWSRLIMFSVVTLSLLTSYKTEIYGVSPCCFSGYF
jgi:hypothetical protein